MKKHKKMNIKDRGKLLKRVGQQISQREIGRQRDKGKNFRGMQFE